MTTCEICGGVDKHLCCTCKVNEIPDDTCRDNCTECKKTAYTNPPRSSTGARSRLKSRSIEGIQSAIQDIIKEKQTRRKLSGNDYTDMNDTEVKQLFNV